VFDAEEKAILDVIRQHGGFCRFRDIMEAFGCRIAGQGRRPDRQHWTALAAAARD
jgi:hypothetical protein